MPSLKEVRNKITSVGSTMQITSAMKMVSAAKLKRAQDAVVQMRPYANKLKEILPMASASVDASGQRLCPQQSGENIFDIAIFSNRGLAEHLTLTLLKRLTVLFKTNTADLMKRFCR